MVSVIPPDLVKTSSFWEVARMVVLRAGGGPVLVDRIWDRQSHKFDSFVARRFVTRATAVYAYEYAAQATFERARATGVAAILDLPSLNSRAFQALQRTEKQKFPELTSASDAYFGSKFEQRQRRRDDEIRLADVIVTNSNLAKISHVEGGADPEKIIVVPLAAPPAIPEVATRFDRSRPLEVLWAGNFSLGKGAHYFLDAWRQLGSAGVARASVYGRVSLPESAFRNLPANISFHGAVPQSELFSALEGADILVFPTLSDGFGMVVTEAFAKALPVIATDRAGAAQLIRHGENGLIIPAADPRALRDALQWCLDNRDKLHAMRFGALDSAKRWQWSDYRRSFIAVLDAALRRAGFSPSFSPSTNSYSTP